MNLIIIINYEGDYEEDCKDYKGDYEDYEGDYEDYKDYKGDYEDYEDYKGYYEGQNKGYWQAPVTGPVNSDCLGEPDRNKYTPAQYVH